MTNTVNNIGAALSAEALPAYPQKPSAEPKTVKEKTAAWLWRVFRCVIIINVVSLFFPPLNPARISQLINKNLSLFTSGISYNSLTANIGRAFRNGWVSESNFKALSINSLIIIVGVVLIAVAGCMSLGNNKLKKLGLVLSFFGGVIQVFGLISIRQIYFIFTRLQNADRISPILPDVMYLFFTLAGLSVLFSVIIFILTPTSPKSEKLKIEPEFQLFLMMLPVIALAFVFSYLPLYGWRYAFFDYNAGETLSMDKFVGFKNFTQLFENPATRRDIVRVLRNTFAMSGLGILTSWVPLAFAVFLSEIRNSRFRKFVQTFTTIPNFISWVLVYAVAIALFSTDGFVNTFINSMGGNANTNYLLSADHTWLKMLGWGLWKGLGWSAIIYIAAISGIDQCLYEAATIDGAGRFAKMWYITVPCLIPTYCVLLLLSIAGILSNGLEQYLVFKNSANIDAIEVLDLYVYNIGIDKGLIPLSTVVGMAKTIISVTLLFAANRISKVIRGQSIV